MKLTPKQKETYEIVQRYLKEKGYFPTYREIGKEMNLKSSAGPYKHIQALIEKGYVTKVDRISRGIKLIHPIEQYGPGYSNNIKSLYWIIHSQENFIVLSASFNNIGFQEYVESNNINTENDSHKSNIDRIKKEYAILVNL